MKKKEFSKMMELLQVKNKEKIVLCNAGNFYIAIGKDTVLLNELYCNNKNRKLKPTKP